MECFSKQYAFLHVSKIRVYYVSMKMFKFDDSLSQFLVILSSPHMQISIKLCQELRERYRRSVTIGNNRTNRICRSLFRVELSFISEAKETLEV